MTHFCYLCFNSVCHLTWHICRKEQKQLQHNPLKKPCGFKRIVTCPNGLKRYHWSNKNGSVIPLSISQQKEVYLCQCFFLWTRSTKNQGVFSMGKRRRTKQRDGVGWSPDSMVNQWHLDAVLVATCGVYVWFPAFSHTSLLYITQLMYVYQWRIGTL